MLTLDWTLAEREAVVDGLSRGLAVVRVEGCDLELLPDCLVPSGRYVYTPRPPLEYSLTIGLELAVWVVNMPRWAAKQPTTTPAG